jgi:hypothetical protein
VISRCWTIRKWPSRCNVTLPKKSAKRCKAVGALDAGECTARRAGLTIEHFSQVGGNLEPGLAEPLERLNRTAVGIADELRLNLHVGQHVNFVAASSNQTSQIQCRSCATLRSFDLQTAIEGNATPASDCALLACSAINQSTNC